MNGTWTDLSPGDCVYSPRGSVHGFKNNTDQPIRVFINFTPAGIEGFFAEAAEEWAQPELDMNRLTAIAEKYGLHEVNMVQHAGPGQIVFNEEIKKKLVDMAVYIRKEALAEQQRLERFGNQPNGSCREDSSGPVDA